MSYESSKIQAFTDLNAWKEAHKLVLIIYSLTKKFPPEEKFELVKQIRRAAVSVSSNIAEGFRRRTAKEKQQFYTTSLASLTEIENQLMISRDVQYGDEQLIHQALQQTGIAGRLIHGLMKSATTLER